MFRSAFLALGLALTSLSAAAAQPGAFPPPKSLGPVEKFGDNLQRSMTLMATSTGLKRNTVRILFYGQSITDSDWTRIVSERLRRQYPLVDFVSENRAILGFSAEYLVKTAEADLYPFYPDLVIFHDYGFVGPFEDIIRRIRERTTADILIATDHVAPLLGEKMDEETDPAKILPPKAGESLHGPWRNRMFLPAIAKKYGAELAEVRILWKQYIHDHKLTPSDLLFDDLHLNAHGNYLMAEIISSHLRHRPDLLADSGDDRVKTYTVGPEGDLLWKDGKLVLPFEGNKVDLICKDGSGSPASIRIDGKKPSEFPELYSATRSQMIGFRTVPVLMGVQNVNTRIVETWNMTITDIADEGKRFRFKVKGSVTGDDGEGESGKSFVSKSGRVAIGPDDFLMRTAAVWSRDRNGQAVELQWKVVPLFADAFVVPAAKNPFGDTVVIAAQGLPNAKHTLEITGSPDTPLAAIRVYRPPLPVR